MATQPASDLSRLSRPAKKRGQNRQSAPRMGLFKIAVNVPPDVAQFRAEYSAYARWLPPHLANVLIGAICTADAHGEDAVTTYEAISAATHTPGLQKRYKCKPVSPHQVERCMPMLQELGVLTWHSEKTRVTGWSDHYGEIRARIYLRLTIANIERLYELAEKARHEKGVRDADRAARRASYEQARNESRKAERARNTAVICEDDEAINSCPTPNGGSSGGTDGGSSRGRIVPNQSFVTEPSCPSSEPGDDEIASPSEQHRRGQAPRTPQDWDESWHRGREWLAGHLGVSPAEIGWNAVELADTLWDTYGEDAVIAAAQRSRCEYQTMNPVGYFVRSAESLCAKAAAEQQLREQEEQARVQRQRLADEIDSWMPRFEAAGTSSNFFRFQIKEWRRRDVTDEQILARLPQWLERTTAKEAQRVAEEAQAKLDRKVWIEYAKRFHDGNRILARRYAYDQTDGRDASIYQFMSQALAAADQEAPSALGEETSGLSLKDEVLAFVQRHATQDRPVSPSSVADGLDEVSFRTIHDILIDLAGGGLTRYEGGPPLDASEGRYWPRETQSA